MEDIAELGLAVDSRDVRTATSDLDRFVGKSRAAELGARAFRLAMGVAVAGVAAFGVGITGAIMRLEQMEKSSRQLDRALANTGNSARTSALEVRRWAEELENRTGRAADEVMKVSSNLATFGFGRETFFRAIELADDMAAAWGGDLRQNLEGLSRALDDPEKGFAMLQKRGVQLSDTQKQLVADFLDLNDKAGAQGVVFEALESQVKGVAEDGYGGLTAAIGRGRKAWDDAFEDLVQGEGVTGDLRDALVDLAAELSSPDFIAAVMGFGAMIVQMVTGIAQAITGAWNALKDFMAFLEGPGAELPAGATMQDAFPKSYSTALSSLNRDLQFIGNGGSKGRSADSLYEGFNFGGDGKMLTLGKGGTFNPYEGQTFGSSDGTADQIQALDDYEKLIAATERRTASLAAEAEAMGLSAVQAQSLTNLHELLAEAEATGVEMTEPRIDQITRLSEAMTDAELTLEGLQMKMENRSPWETMAEEMEHIQELLDRGKIGWDDYAIGVGKSVEEMVGAYAGGANDVIGNVEKLTDALGLEGKKAFEIQKALGIARAVVSGAESITHSFNAGTAIGGPPLGFAFAGIAAAATAAQIAALASTSYQSKSVPASGGGATSAQQPVAPAAQAQSRTVNIVLPAGQRLFSDMQIEQLIRELNDKAGDGLTIQTA